MVRIIAPCFAFLPLSGAGDKLFGRFPFGQSGSNGKRAASTAKRGAFRICSFLALAFYRILLWLASVVERFPRNRMPGNRWAAARCAGQRGGGTIRRARPGEGLAAVGKRAAVVCLALAGLALACDAAAQVRDPYGVAVIVGNRDYGEIGLSDVDYAVRDARAFERYVLDVLGFDPDNVLVLENATRGRMFEAFGRPGDPPGGPSDLWALLDTVGRSDVSVFYSGHGAPGLDDGKGYLLPVDVPARYAQEDGYPIAALYERLAALRSATGRSAKSARVYLDACFSGRSQRGSVFAGVSPVLPTVALPEAVSDGVAVLSAGGAKEFASWDEDAGHGMFTHHLLDALYGLGDANGDGRVTAVEAKGYLDANMTPAAWLQHRVRQTANLSVGPSSVPVILSMAPPDGFPARPVLPVLASGGADGAPPPLDSAAFEESLGLSREDRVLVQRGLESAGGSVGSVDGVFGPRTRAALRAWQEQRGLTSTGYLTREQADNLLALGRDEARVSSVIGDVFRDCADCPEMVVVPSGSFMMGSPPSEEGRDDDEGPVHRVSILSAFAVGVYEVTRGEFGRFVSSTGRSMGDKCWTLEDGVIEERSGRSWRSPGYSQTDMHPAVCVGWEDAQAYVDWLSRETGEAYRLLSESEWEYVARAGTTTRYHWGDAIGRNLANCRGCGSRWDGEGASPVGSFGENAFGLHDVHGNVAEWVEDCRNDSYAGAPNDGSAWKSGDCSWHVLRGGTWDDDPRGLRAAIRNSLILGIRVGGFGFRVARTFTP